MGRGCAFTGAERVVVCHCDTSRTAGAGCGGDNKSELVKNLDETGSKLRGRDPRHTLAIRPEKPGRQVGSGLDPVGTVLDPVGSRERVSL